jgi:CheY-like chemotaxis protein
VLYYPSATPFLGRFLGPDLLTFSIVPLFERCVVLVADDEPGILRLASHALTRHGYIVIPASDGLSALRACQERDGPIHLFLLDIMMLGMAGARIIRRSAPTSRFYVFFLSASLCPFSL